jgi:hypothetical protein
MNRLVRNWWPPVAFLVPILVVQRMWLGDYEASGHAAGHLGGATVVFGLTFVVTLIVWATPPDLRRLPALWILASAVCLAGLVMTIGNLRVVDAIGADNWTDELAGIRGPGRPGFESGHQLAERGMWIAALCALLLAGWLLWKGAVRTGPGIAAMILCVIFPPWIFPGVGLLVVAVALVVNRARRLRGDSDPACLEDGDVSTKGLIQSP